jgi:hypothetical protein
VSWDPARARALIAKLRHLEKFEKRSADMERELADLRQEKQARDDAQLTEIERERVQRQRAEAELLLVRQDSRDLANRYEVQNLAGRLGIIDPDAAVKLLDWAALDYDPDGRPQNVEAALRQLLVDRPYLQAPQAAPAAPPTGQPATAGVNPTNPATTNAQANGQRIYRVSELQDFPFYRAHADDIKLAFQQGRIQPG